MDRPALTARWLAWSIGGLILIGAGVSVVGEAVIAKGAAEAWFWLGTAGLVILNTGVSCVGQGVLFKARRDAMDVRDDTRSAAR